MGGLGRLTMYLATRLASWRDAHDFWLYHRSKDLSLGLFFSSGAETPTSTPDGSEFKVFIFHDL